MCAREESFYKVMVIRHAKPPALSPVKVAHTHTHTRTWARAISVRLMKGGREDHEPYKTSHEADVFADNLASCNFFADQIHCCYVDEGA